MTIRSLCITEGADRPTIEMFIGMHRAGIKLTVVCPADHPNHKLLCNASIAVIDIPLKKNFDAFGTALLREELIRGRYQIIHTFNSRALTNGLRAARNLHVKSYRLSRHRRQPEFPGPNVVDALPQSSNRPDRLRL